MRRRKNVDTTKQRDIAESLLTGHKSGADMARPYNGSQPTVSRMVAQHRRSAAEVPQKAHEAAMPNLDFYGIGSDLDRVLEFVFSQPGLRVFESYSAFGQELAHLIHRKDSV